MYEEKPLTLLVVPAINNSTAADATEYYSTTIAQPLTEQGFYVLPVEITNVILKEAGIADGAQLKDVPPAKFHTMFGADAVLFVTINEWDTNYYVTGGNVTVGLGYHMVSTKTGNTLWSYRNRVVVNTSGNSNSGGGILGAIIETAINTAIQDYLPIARQVNYIALGSIPVGKYHPQHGQDGAFRVVNAELVEKQ